MALANVSCFYATRIPMDEIRSLRDEVRRSVFGQAWHGPALLEALAAFSALEAAARPIDAAHSAWEVGLHALAWIEEVTRRLDGSTPADPARGDWPSAPAPDEQEWEHLRSEIVAAHSILDETLAAFPHARLNERVGSGGAGPAAGNGTTYELMLHGLAQHNAYHSGQLALLRRALPTAV